MPGVNVAARAYPSRRVTPRGRLGSILILALLAAGCLVLWLGVPAGGMWLSAKLTDSFGWHMPVALVLIVGGMLVLAAGLAWLNDLYLRVTGGHFVSSEAPIRRRGPLEPMLIATLVLAACAFAAWFFLLAENPTLTA